MRSALCLSGIIGGGKGNDGIGEIIDYKACYDSFKEHVININNTDVFIHSWSVDYEKEICDLYRPVRSIFEKQIKFDTRGHVINHEGHVFRNFSKSYGIQRSIELKRQYEKENNFIYDCVMISRFDMLFFVNFDFSKYDLTHLHAGHYNHTYRYLNSYDNLVEADRVNLSMNVPCLDDLWFFGGSKVMDIFQFLYNDLPSYRQKENIHGTIWQHVNRHIGNPRQLVRFEMYRWFDYEIYRYKILKQFDLRGE